MAGKWLFAGGVALLMAVVGLGTWRSGQILRHWTPPHNLILSLPDNLLRLVLLGLCVGLGYLFGPGPRALGWQTDALVADAMLGVLVGLAMALLLGVAGQVAIRRWGPRGYSTKMVQCILPANGREWPAVLLALLPAAGLEELLFRSLPLAGLNWLVPAWWLLWPLSLLFGLLHWPQGGWGVAGTALAGLGLSFLFLATGSLWPPLVAHYVLNVSQLILARWIGLKPLRGPAPEAELRGQEVVDD